MNQFIWDMIHLTEGEKLIKYWWLWLIIAGISFTFICYRIHVDVKNERF